MAPIMLRYVCHVHLYIIVWFLLCVGVATTACFMCMLLQKNNDRAARLYDNYYHKD